MKIKYNDLLIILRCLKCVRAIFAPLMWLKFGVRKSFFKYTTHSTHLKELKNIHQGEECFIIGNGPSLQVSDLDKLKGKYTFAFNALYRLLTETEFRPTYYMITDPIGYRLFKDIFHRKNLYQKMFVEYKARHHGINASKDLYYVNILNPFYIDRYKKVSPGFSSDISDHIEMSYTVIYHAMQIAAYMGFSKIYLIGVDHSYSYTINVNGETVKKIYKITQKR